jgi:hypothetical protein
MMSKKADPSSFSIPSYQQPAQKIKQEKVDPFVSSIKIIEGAPKQRQVEV